MILNQDVYTDDPIRHKVKVGYIDSDGETFVKVVKRAKHYFSLVKGYAIQKEVFQKLLTGKVNWIRIDEEDTGHRLVSHVDTWIEDGAIWTGKHGKQRTLSEKYMQVLDAQT